MPRWRKTGPKWRNSWQSVKLLEVSIAEHTIRQSRLPSDESSRFQSGAFIDAVFRSRHGGWHWADGCSIDRQCRDYIPQYAAMMNDDAAWVDHSDLVLDQTANVLLLLVDMEDLRAGIRNHRQ